MKYLPPVMKARRYGASIGTRGIEIVILGPSETGEGDPLKLIEDLRKITTEDQFNDILIGQTHLVFQGGSGYDAGAQEIRQDTLNFIGELSQLALDYQVKVLKHEGRQLRPPFMELVVSGINYTGADEYYDNFNYVTCEVMLPTSNAGQGLEKDKRYHPFAMVELCKHPFSTFVFRVKTKEDWDEIKKEFIDTQYLTVPLSRVHCIPDTGTREEQLKYAEAAYNICANYGCRVGLDLQIIWDK